MKAQALEVAVICYPGSSSIGSPIGTGSRRTQSRWLGKSRPWRTSSPCARLYRLLRQIRPAIVHAHFPKGGLLGMIAAWLAGVPICIYHIRGLRYATSTGLKRRLVVDREALLPLGSSGPLRQPFGSRRGCRGEGMPGG